MYEKNIEEQTIAVQEKKVLEYVNVTVDLCVYRLTLDRTSSDDFVHPVFMNGLKKTVQEGFAAPGSISRYLSGEAASVEMAPDVSLMPAGYAKLMNDWGFSLHYLPEKEKSKVDTSPYTDPYHQLVEKGVSENQILQMDYSSHMAFDRFGTVLPLAYGCDYIDANLTNEFFRLRDALRVLKNDPRMYFSEKGGIVDIPYYNASESASSFISALFRPTAEDAILLWAKQKSYKTKYPSTLRARAIHDLDMLGLRAAGAEIKPVFGS